MRRIICVLTVESKYDVQKERKNKEKGRNCQFMHYFLAHHAILSTYFPDIVSFCPPSLSFRHIFLGKDDDT